MPVLNEKVQRKFVGGGDGSANCPYTVYEYDWMSGSGSWNGGYVEGMGYVLAEVTVTGSYSAGCQETTYNGLGSFVETIERDIPGYDEALGFATGVFVDVNGENLSGVVVKGISDYNTYVEGPREAQLRNNQLQIIQDVANAGMTGQFTIRYSGNYMYLLNSSGDVIKSYNNNVQ